MSKKAKIAHPFPPSQKLSGASSSNSIERNSHKEEGVMQLDWQRQNLFTTVYWWSDELRWEQLRTIFEDETIDNSRMNNRPTYGPTNVVKDTSKGKQPEVMDFDSKGKQTTVVEVTSKGKQLVVVDLDSERKQPDVVDLDYDGKDND
ncbi:hypothetical protein Salat_1087300 [Sesamum alatum]|uniref:Uncharacterized protein n=1 Tax=Sesamum alatum TaxID=300844 RepID=A0AAE2CSU8_9LAMI|nr:hypothetical protein Salat_1087300 [Sesamum alatum]